jgi:hypothetical protein
MHFDERGFLVSHVTESKTHAHAVEVIGFEREPLAVALDAGEHQALVEQPVAAELEHRIVDVGEPSLPAGPDAPRIQTRQISGAASEIEHSVPRLEAGELDAEALP